ncbi:hypothetical protein F4777DRAFT_371743 [Nemania sp. FL0916]|nr:hypothetical protein F4777DRAFT_371743 [Nemania sp. FL0916]
MAETSSTPVATPKRKRDDVMAEMRFSASPARYHGAKTVFSFQPPNLQPIIRSSDPTEDGNRSPRSRVAQKFRDLAIEESGEGPKEGPEGPEDAVTSRPEGGGGAVAAADAASANTGAASSTGAIDWACAGTSYLATVPVPAPVSDTQRFEFDAAHASPATMQLDPDDADDAATASARKRPKILPFGVPTIERTISQTTGEMHDSTMRVIPADGQINDTSSPATGSGTTNTFAPVDFSIPKPIPSIGRIADTKSRGRRRTGTPPLSSRRKSNAQSQSIKASVEEEEPVIIDPIRAALTWHEDEITIYDPEDKDDDGTGINGIGFKPTAAVAYHRAQKRRQQLADYKKREESEARARRNQRRREQLGGGTEMVRKHSIVRVHFSDAPPTTVMTT